MTPGAVRARRRRCQLAALVALLSIVSACGSSTTTSSAPHALEPALTQRLDTAIDAAVKQASIPGAVVGVWDPHGSYIRTFGVADKAARTPMKSDMYTRIGSVTKTFTVTALLQLADQGKLGLDDPIAKYVDGVPRGNEITLAELARMQSGLFNYSASKAFQHALFTDPRRQFSPPELLHYAFTEASVFPPGEGFEYCNTNTVLLGLVVEKVGGQPLQDYIRDHIVSPLGMRDTSFPTTNAFPQPHAQGYTDTAEGTEAVATDWNPSWGWAAGAMISTLNDLHTWALALATGKLLTPAMQQRRLQTVRAPGYPPQDGYGLGIFSVAGWIGHNGSLPGYQTVAIYLPPQQLKLVIMINTDIEYQGNEPSTTLATAITRVLSPDHVYKLGTDQQPSPTTTPR